MTPRQCGSHSKPQPLLQKTRLFNTSETLAMYGGVCLYTHALAHVCRLLATYVGRWPLVCCCRQLKIKPILLKRYVVVRVRIVPTESIQPSFMLHEQGGMGVVYNENNFKTKGTTKEQFKLKYRNHSRNKPWSKSTSTIGILQLIIDANIYQFTL